MILETLEKKSLVEQVEERILSTIKKSKLEPGDKLPSELEFTESLGVSRTIVREALSRLRMMGLVESKKKRGLIMREPDVFSGCSQILDAAFLSDKTQKDLYEMRLVLEIGIIDFLFLNKNDEGIEKLKAIVKREENAPNEKTRVKMDIEFHRTLYKIAGNILLFQFQSLLEPFFETAADRDQKGKAKRSKTSHRKLVKELESGTPESFRLAMRAHLSPHIEAIKEKE